MQNAQQTESAASPTPRRDRPILDSVTATIAATPLEMSPFGHIRLEGVFPDEFYRQILPNLPALELYGEQKHKDAMMSDGRSTRLRFELDRNNIARLPSGQREFWNGFLDNFESNDLELELKRKFAPVLRARFGTAPETIEVDQRLVLFKDLPGYRISIHADNDDKVVTTQFYLPSADSQARLGTSFHRRGDDGEFEKVVTLPFTPNSGYSFAVTEGSWHSVEGVTEADGARNTLMAIHYRRKGMRRFKGSLRKLFSSKSS